MLEELKMCAFMNFNGPPGFGEEEDDLDDDDELDEFEPQHVFIAKVSGKSCLYCGELMIEGLINVYYLDGVIVTPGLKCVNCAHQDIGDIGRQRVEVVKKEIALNMMGDGGGCIG